MKTNLILTTIQNLDSNDVLPFLSSLKKTDSDADVHFFSSGINEDTRSYIRSYGASLEDFPYLNFRNRQPLLIFWRFWKLRLSRLDFSRKCQLAKKVFHLMGARFIYYYDFLKKNRDRYNIVMLTDCRDVYFQRDPFCEIKKNGIHFFLEADSQRIGTCSHNTKMILNTFGREVLNTMSSYRVSCAGTIIGDVDSLLIYLEAMINQLCNARYMFSGCDQGVHNYLIYKRFLTNFEVYDNYSGSVFTMGCEKRESIQINEKGEVIKPDGGVYPILHQYDRHKHLAADLFSRVADTRTLRALKN